MDEKRKEANISIGKAWGEGFNERECDFYLGIGIDEKGGIQILARGEPSNAQMATLLLDAARALVGELAGGQQAKKERVVVPIGKPKAQA